MRMTLPDSGFLDNVPSEILMSVKESLRKVISEKVYSLCFFHHLGNFPISEERIETAIQLSSLVTELGLEGEICGILLREPERLQKFLVAAHRNAGIDRLEAERKFPTPPQQQLPQFAPNPMNYQMPPPPPPPPTPTPTRNPVVHLFQMPQQPPFYGHGMTQNQYQNWAFPYNNNPPGACWVGPEQMQLIRRQQQHLQQQMQQIPWMPPNIMHYNGQRPFGHGPPQFFGPGPFYQQPVAFLPPPAIHPQPPTISRLPSGIGSHSPPAPLPPLQVHTDFGRRTGNPENPPGVKSTGIMDGGLNCPHSEKMTQKKAPQSPADIWKDVFGSYDVIESNMAAVNGEGYVSSSSGKPSNDPTAVPADPFPTPMAVISAPAPPRLSPARQTLPAPRPEASPASFLDLCPLYLLQEEELVAEGEAPAEEIAQEAAEQQEEQSRRGNSLERVPSVVNVSDPEKKDDDEEPPSAKKSRWNIADFF